MQSHRVTLAKHKISLYTTTTTHSDETTEEFIWKNAQTLGGIMIDCTKQ